MDDVINSGMDTPGFSLQTGYYLAYASNYAYEDFGGEWTERLGLGRARLFARGQFHGFVGALEKVTVLAFRGTESIANCLTDAETLLVERSPYPGRVHMGFVEAVEQVWPEVVRLLGASDRALPVWVTGHSLGGAMATLASVRLAAEGYRVRAAYTYGSPRVGNRFFRDAYRLPNYRFVNDNDIVPHLPFRWCYKHVGEPKLLDHLGHLAEEKQAWRHKKKSLCRHAKHVQRRHRRRPAVEHGLLDFDWLVDHLLHRYLDAIRRVLHGSHARRHRHEGQRRRVSRGTVRLDAAVSGVAPPHSRRAPRRKMVISEADFIAAFARPPRLQ